MCAIGNFRLRKLAVFGTLCHHVYMRVHYHANRFLRKRYIFGFLLVIPVTGCGARGEKPRAESAAEQKSQRPQIPADPMLMLPAECFGAAFVDIEAIRNSKLIDPQNNLAEGELTPAQKKFADYLFEHSSTAALCGVKTESDDRREPDAVIAIKGKYSRAEVESLSQALAADDPNDDIFGPDRTSANQSAGYRQLFKTGRSQAYLLDETTLIFAGSALVSKVFTAMEGARSSRFVDSALYQKLNGFSGFSGCAFCGSMVLPSDVKKKVSRRSSRSSLLKKYTEIVNGITVAGGRLELTPDLQVSIILETSSPDHPPTLGEALKGLLMLGKFLYQDATFSAVADQVNVSSEGLIARIHARATREQVARLIDLFKNAIDQQARIQNP